MDVQLQIEEMPDYLAVRFTGKTKEAWHKFALLAGRCQRTKKNKLLLDFTETYGDMSLVERYTLAAKAEIFIFFNVEKIAVIGRPEQFDYKRFGEMVARNRWVDARLFASVEYAKEWLLLDVPKAQVAGHR